MFGLNGVGSQSQSATHSLSRRAMLLLGTGVAYWGLDAAHATGKRRMVSVGGAITEIVYALNAQAELVGVDTTSVYPEAATQLPRVGYARTLSLEGVLALSPSLILATEDAGPPIVIKQLKEAGVPLEVLAANHRFEGLIDRVMRVGVLTGRDQQAVALQSRLHQDWGRANALVASRAGLQKPSVRVLFVLAHAPNQIMVAGKDTSAQAMIEYAGATNAIDGFSGYKPLTPEAVVAARPDLVLLTDQGLHAAGGINGILKLPGLAHTPAGQYRKVLSFEAMFLLGFGPRLPAAVTALHAGIGKAMQA